MCIDYSRVGVECFLAGGQTEGLLHAALTASQHSQIRKWNPLPSY